MASILFTISRSRARTIASMSCAAMVSLLVIPVQSQNLRVALPQATTLDPPGGHISALSDRNLDDYSIPRDIAGSARHFRLDFDVLVVSRQNGQLLYFDSNDNKDFTDDGDPQFFPYQQNQMRFVLPPVNSESDSIRYLIERKPEIPDSLLLTVMDSAGNLLPRPTQVWRTLHRDTAFSGRAGTFLFTYWLTVRQGSMNLDGRQIDVGVNLHSSNSTFSDANNFLLVDSDGNHQFDITSQLEVFPIAKDFRVANHHLKVIDVDPRGQWLAFSELAPDVVAPHHDPDLHASPYFGEMCHLDSSLFNLALTSLDGRDLTISELNKRFVLLNFWGEWCAPCLAEIPELVKARSLYGQDQLAILGFVRTERPGAAVRVAQEYKMVWPQVLLTDSLARFFSIFLYPTNILIFPGGSSAVRTQLINSSFFEHYIGRTHR